jgi:hypothetical protein
VRSIGLTAAVALVFHSLLDGVGIGVGFQAGATVGVAVAVAVIAHDFADGFNTFTITTLYRNARRRAYTLLGLDALAPVAGVRRRDRLGGLLHEYQQVAWRGPRFGHRQTPHRPRPTGAHRARVPLPPRCRQRSSPDENGIPSRHQ